jgi:hypothetical protein
MFRGLLSSSKRLPEAVLSELVNILFTSLVPIIVIGVTMAAIGTLIALKNGDRIVWALVVAGVLTTVVRGLLIPAYRRQKEAPQTAEPARVWERRYAIGSYTLATLLGLLSARALTTGDPLVAMLITGMIFGYGSGLVVRTSVRPIICAGSLALAVVPTVLGLSMYSAGAGDNYTKAAYAAQAFLIAAFAIASLESVAQSAIVGPPDHSHRECALQPRWPGSARRRQRWHRLGAAPRAGFGRPRVTRGRGPL